MVIITFNLLGLGLGPVRTGLPSHLLATRLAVPADSVRYALCSATLFSIAGGVLFLVAARRLAGETQSTPFMTIAQETP